MGLITPNLHIAFVVFRRLLAPHGDPRRGTRLTIKTVSRLYQRLLNGRGRQRCAENPACLLLFGPVSVAFG